MPKRSIKTSAAGKNMMEPGFTSEDVQVEGSLRPKTLDHYIGQEKIKKSLKIYIAAAKERGDSLDHILFYGPPGLGKTTLAQIMASEMGVNMKWQQYLIIFKKEIFYLLMKSTVLIDRLKKCFILQWKILL